MIWIYIKESSVSSMETKDISVKDLFKKLFVDGVHLITKIKKNMKNSLMLLQDKIALRK